MIDPFAERIIAVHGDAGKLWLDRLPEILRECERRWAITVEAPFGPLSYNYVAPARTADGASIVLKVGVPHPELRREIAALRAFDGQGAMRLLDADPDQGVLVLEHAKPGTPLRMLTDDVKATSIASRIMRQLWRPVPKDAEFSTLAQWFGALHRSRETYRGGTGPIPGKLVQEAENSFAALSTSSPATVLLHGDLHHDNIVAAERQPWLALDPKGLLGDPAYEVGPWLQNISPQLLTERSAKEIMERRVLQFADELGFERERIIAWGIAHSVLSACWCLEDHDPGWEWPIFCAQTLAELS